MGALGPMGLYGPIVTLWNGGADQWKFPEDQLKLHGCVNFTKETCVCGFKMSNKWSFGPIRNDARPIVGAGLPRMEGEREREIKRESVGVILYYLLLFFSRFRDSHSEFQKERFLTLFTNRRKTNS